MYIVAKAENSTIENPSWIVVDFTYIVHDMLRELNWIIRYDLKMVNVASFALNKDLVKITLHNKLPIEGDPDSDTYFDMYNARFNVYEKYEIPETSLEASRVESYDTKVTLESTGNILFSVITKDGDHVVSSYFVNFFVLDDMIKSKKF